MLKFMTIRCSLIFVVLISTFLLFPINVFAHYQDDKATQVMEGENYSELITDYFKKILIDIKSLGDLFSSSGIVDYIEQIQFKIGHGMIQKFRWIALVQYNGMRVSQRMMRYYSGQGFDF